MVHCTNSCYSQNQNNINTVMSSFTVGARHEEGHAAGAGTHAYLRGRPPREEDFLTRRPVALWDRIKWLVLLAVIWFLLVWSLMADNPLVGFVDAVRIEVHLAGGSSSWPALS